MKKKAPVKKRSRRRKETPNTASVLDIKTIKRAAGVIRAARHGLRSRMLALMAKKKQVTVTQLYDELKLEQSVASQHLAILRRAGLVRTTRTGRHVFYSLDNTRLARLAKILTAF